MKWALLARGDQGGIGTQSRAIAKHLKPDAIIVVDLEDAGRGRCDRAYYQRLCPDVLVKVGRRHLTDRGDAAWLAERNIKTILAIEGWYSSEFPSRLATNNIKRVLYANPELYPGPAEPADQIIVPTNWLVTDVEDRAGVPVQVLPWPTEPIEHIAPTSERCHFVHIDAPAFVDREGTDLLLNATRTMVPNFIDLTVFERNGVRNWPRWVNVIREPTVENPLDVVRPDVLVQPRRYGGLSLLQWEAAERGVAILCLDRAPEDSLPGRHCVPVTSSYLERMKGGHISVYHTEPDLLVAEMLRLAMDPERVRALKSSALAWAKSLAWSRMKELWHAVLSQ